MARFHRKNPPPLLPAGKDYTFFRAEVREDFQRCCAHCMRHEDWGGTAEHYQLDHFEPQKRRPDLIDEFSNIYYCCYRCNLHKSVTWPKADEQAAGKYFVDLCQDNFEKHYKILPDGNLELLTEAAKYTAKKLILNSPELVRQRASILKAGYAIDKPHWPIK